VDVTKDPKAALAGVGAVVETPEFYPYLTPKETLAYLGELRGMSKEDIDRRSKEVLETVKMTEWADKRIGKFSKGMKQRIAIAQAILHEPPVIILDEPTSGLDPRGMVEVREILMELKKADYTVFMSSHLLNEVQEVCTDVALIKIDPSQAPVELTPVQLGDSSQVAVGESVVAIGNPLGLDFSLSSGVVSATDRELQSPNGATITGGIQTDAAINSGNSGGPLFNANGEVIGINEQIASQGGGNEGIGFAVPINTAVQVMQAMQNGEYAPQTQTQDGYGYPQDGSQGYGSPDGSGGYSWPY
jgi:energy-coupling factor transporter ATP-binding protein EcfA2